MLNQESSCGGAGPSLEREEKDALGSRNSEQNEATFGGAKKAVAYAVTGRTRWFDMGDFVQSDRGVKIDKTDLPLISDRTVTVDIYAHFITGGTRKRVRLHTLFCPSPKGRFTDHKNRDKLDNRRDNLRSITIGESNINKPCDVPKTSRFRGVDKFVSVSHGGKYRYEYWRVVLCRDKKQFHIGLFKDEIDAARAYNEAARNIQGEFAILNEIP